MKSTPEIIADGLADRGVPVLVIGGMALPAFDIVRQTIDLDCLMVSSQAAELHTLLTEAGYVEFGRTEGFVQYTSPSMYHMDVDVMLVDQDTFDKLMARSRRLDVGRASMRVPCAAHMVMLKLHAMKNHPKRELKDLNDIVEILRNNPEDIPECDLREICTVYGPEGIYARIKELR